MKTVILMLAIVAITADRAIAGPYAPAAGQSGSTAIAADSPMFSGWAVSFENLIRGPMSIANPAGGLASFGVGTSALGPAGTDGGNVVSLGDGGQITLGFAKPITNGAGPDFAVFENGFADNFLELAFVEVSSNGTDFLRFPAISVTQTSSQVASFGAIDPTNVDNLAGKYRVGFGTPFDLGVLAGLSPVVDVNQIRFVKIVDVVGSIDPQFGSLDSLGNIVNDPFATNFASGGFDLDGVGVIHAIPEPTSIVLAALALAGFILAARHRR